MSTSWIRVCYGVLLGVVLAITVGFGVLAFETGPKLPQPPGVTFEGLSGNNTDQEDARMAKQIDSFYSDLQTYREHYPMHQRNVFLWFAGFGLVFGAIGVALPAIVNYIRFGFVFGGLLLVVGGTWFALQAVPLGTPPAGSVLALLSAGTPSELDAAGRFLRFAISIVGLLILLFVGLWRLTDWMATAAAPAPARAMLPAYPAAGAQMMPVSVAPYGAAPGVEYAPAAPQPSDPTKWAPPVERAGETDTAAPPASAVEVPAAPPSDTQG